MPNWALIISLTIVISLPFIVSSIVIPIKLWLDKRKQKTKTIKRK